MNYLDLNLIIKIHFFWTPVYQFVPNIRISINYDLNLKNNEPTWKWKIRQFSNITKIVSL